jgi:hypothetical protein
MPKSERIKYRSSVRRSAGIERRGFRAAVAAALAAVAVCALAEPATAATAAGTFNLFNSTGNAGCLTATPATNGAPLTLTRTACNAFQWGTAPSPAPMVFAYRDSAGKQLCIDTAWGHITAGTQVVIGVCTGSATQRWSFRYVGWGGVDMYELVQPASNMCITMAESVPISATIQPCFPSETVAQAFMYRFSVG